MSPHIEMKDVSKSYPRSSSSSGLRVSLAMLLARQPSQQRTSQQCKRAVDRLSLSIGTGERVGIVGRNGAGKSTLLSMLAGVITPSTGTITIHGHVTSILTLGMGLREDLSGLDNIYLDGEFQGRSRADVDRVIDEVAAFADIGEFIEYPVRTYSTGMKARLAFAMTFHIEPEILLIDEALSVGDATFSVKATQKIRDLCGKGKIVIIVSHSMESVIEICTRCLWMENGRIVMDGDPAAVTRAYVESVRKNDEAVMLKRFRSYMGARSLRQGCEIEQIQLGQGLAWEPQSVLNAGEDAEIKLVMRIQGTVACPDLRLVIRRLDGLILTDTRLSESAEKVVEPFVGTVTYSIGMRPLVLSPGMYRIMVELLDTGEIVAERSTLVEIIAENVPTGGQTALLYPSFVQAKAVSR